MSAKEIFIDCKSSLAYEQTEREQYTPPVIKVTTKAEIERNKAIVRNERIFSLSAAGVIIALDGAVFAAILKIGQLIGLQTGSFTAAGCYLTAMWFFTLTFLEAAGRLKHSALIDGMAHIWRVIAAAGALTLIIYSALRSPDSGGSIIIVTLAGILLRRHIKN
ncbi:MAG: hypothetical protein K6F91_01235 [Ruminococcus sp.]|nr:hypothetical protein [Ruminococcus sp.]